MLHGVCLFLNTTRTGLCAFPFLQSDQEIELGLPLTPSMVRKDMNMPKAQQFFIEVFLRVSGSVLCGGAGVREVRAVGMGASWSVRWGREGRGVGARSKGPGVGGARVSHTYSHS
jgi:hypothetical protein